MKKGIRLVVAMLLSTLTLLSSFAFAIGNEKVDAEEDVRLMNEEVRMDGSAVEGEDDDVSVTSNNDFIYLGEYKVTASVLNVRKGPGKKYGVKAQLKKGTIVSGYSTSKSTNNWMYIGYYNKSGKWRHGYAVSKYLSCTDPASLISKE